MASALLAAIWGQGCPRTPKTVDSDLKGPDVPADALADARPGDALSDLALPEAIPEASPGDAPEVHDTTATTDLEAELILDLGTDLVKDIEEGLAPDLDAQPEAAVDEVDADVTQPDYVEVYQCPPECLDKLCGPDGCGGVCGVCGENESCSTAGICWCKNEVCEDSCCQPGHACFQGICCEPQCAGKECGDDGCGGVCGDCGPQGSCEADSCICQSYCVGKECGDDGCGGSCGWCDTGFCTEEGTCQWGIGCVYGHQPTCGGCSCEECVCAMMPSCCNSSWDWGCASLCAMTCEGCDAISTCGDGQCQAESKENCGTCPGDCECPGGTYCDGQWCRTDYCKAGVDFYGCCQEDVLIRCPDGEQQEDCSQSGQICGWWEGGGNKPKGYNCGGIGEVDPAGDPAGEHPLECPQCVANCVGKKCGDDGCGGNCGDCTPKEV